AGVDLGKRLARLDSVPALLEADDPDCVVDRVRLGLPAGAEMKCSVADADRTEGRDRTRTRSSDLTNNRGTWQPIEVGVAALRTDPTFVCVESRAAGNSLLGTAPALGLVDGEI